MANFPQSLDDDLSLPRVDSNITQLGPAAINALRSAMFSVELEVGIGGSGTAGSIANRLNNALSQDGTRILPSALAGAGLVTLPITSDQISPTAGIQESKLSLTFSTASLYNLYITLKTSVDILNGFLSLTGVKLEPHIDGTDYNHLLSAIHVDPYPIVKTSPISIPSIGTNVINRDSTNAYTLIQDISSDLVVHEKSDSTANVTATTGGTVPPTNYAHMAAGVFVDPTSFSTIPQTNNDVQKVIEYFDNSSLLLLGSRTQNLYSNGISRSARSGSLLNDGYGSSIVIPTPVIAYLLAVPPGPAATSPVDDINHGDDIILFQPTSQQLSTFNFDAQFSQVAPGDIITVNYGNGITAQFAVESVKSLINGSTRTYAVRINTKNLYSTSIGIARIDRPLYNTNKYGVLATARCQNELNVLESLIVASPKSAIALGNGFSATLIDISHFNLYLSIYQNGDPSHPVALPAIDITGNQGQTPGQYTIDTVVNATNKALRAPGFNYRFIAFKCFGQFGIMLADPYNNTAFSIVSGVVDGYGNYNSSSLSSYPNNVIDNYGNGLYTIDPLGLGLSGSNLASPPIASAYASAISAQAAPTLIFFPLRRNYYYVNGVERDSLKSDPLVIDQIVDSYGDGYWPATILPSPATIVLSNRVQVAYQINYNLTNSGLKAGKTVVIQPAFPISDSRYNYRDYGRFIIQSIAFNGCDTSTPTTVITVYDGVHGAGSSPAITSTNIPVNLYFSDDSVAFDAQNVADQSSTGYPYKRFFEIFVDQTGHTYAHERARFSTLSNGLSGVGLYGVSPKLLGYSTGINASESLRAIQLAITSYNTTTGSYTGQLQNPNAPTVNFGPTTVGKQGITTRFYDESNIDYIDIILDYGVTLGTITTPLLINLFDSLETDQENFLLSTCQVNDSNGQISYLNDSREFGNTSEENFTTSALDFISAPTRLIDSNGIVRGFDVLAINANLIQFDGGVGIVNGNIVQLNPQNIEIPIIIEAIGGSPASTVNTINWFVCVNKNGELELVASTDYNIDLQSMYGSLTHTRVFYALNPNISTKPVYQIRGTYFADLILNQSDLTPIAIATATVTQSGSAYVMSSLTCSDARRFAAAGYNGLNEPFILSSNGSFRSLTSAVNYVNQLNNYVSSLVNANSVGSKIIVRGNVTISSSIILDFLNAVSIIGDGGSLIITSAQGLVLGSNISIDNLIINYTYNPISDGGYSSTNLVNTGNGSVYCSVVNSSNITIRNCTFNASTADRYSFINFDFDSYTSSAQNINILRNKFTNIVADSRAAIAFIANPTNTLTPIQYPTLTVCNIQDNVCDRDQMIIISAVRVNDIISNEAIVANNVFITSNTCGVIAFLTQAGQGNNIPNSSNIQDKNNCLTIDKNTCKYIASLDSDGYYIEFGQTVNTVPTNFVTIDVGNVKINNNTTSWIHTGTGNARNSSITISGNSLYAYSSSYLAKYENLNTSVNGPNTAIVVRAKLSASGVVSTITNNSTHIGSYINGASSATYSYSGYTAVYDSTIMIGNNFSGIAASASNICVYFEGPQGTIQNNIINRVVSPIGAYISGPNGDGATSNAIVAGNFFDFTTVDGSSTVLGINIPSTWVFTRNKNQTECVYLPVYDNTSASFSLFDGYIFNITTSADTVMKSPSFSHFNGDTGLFYDLTNAFINLIKPFNASQILDRGVKVTSISVGAFLLSGSMGTTVPASTDFISLNVSARSIPASNDLNVQATYGTVPSFSGSSAFIVNTSGQLAALKASTQIITYTPPSNSQYFTIDTHTNLTVFLSVQLTFDSGDAYELHLSPVKITYVW